MYQHLAGSMDTVFSQESLDRIKKIKDIAHLTIDFIGNFEDELKKIWLKPKFARNSNYVLTLDRIADKKSGLEILAKILKYKGFNNQFTEWLELGIVDKKFNPKEIIKNERLNKDWQFLPIDTKHFKDLEIEIIGLFDNLDDALDGRLIKSDNFQALNTLLPKYKEQVQTIYIDPPFNTGDDFDYVDRFQNSTWLTLMHNRLELAKDFLNNKGGIFLHLDWNAQYLGRILLSDIFSDENFINEIIWRIGWVSGYKTQVDAFVRNHDTIFVFAKTSRSDYFFKKSDSKIPYQSFDKKTIENELKNIIKKWGINKKEIKNIKLVIKDNNANVYKIGLETQAGKYNIEDTWNCSEYEDLHSNKIKRNAKEYTPHGSEITQKPEQLLQRIISLTTNDKDIVFDFFSGSGTTVATAQKLKRKWLGVEMGDYFETDILFRIKQVLSGFGKNEPCGISKDVNWQGGGFFKYYALEQYEDVLKRANYNPAEKELQKIDFDFSNLENGAKVERKKQIDEVFPCRKNWRIRDWKLI